MTPIDCALADILNQGCCPVTKGWIDFGHCDWASVKITPERMCIRINRPAAIDLNFIDACDWTAQKLAQDWIGHDLYLGLSGGVDSELVANVLLKNRIKFVPFILHIDQFNELEAWHAHHWCWRNNVTPVIYHMSVTEFEQKLVPHLAKLYHTRQFGIIMLLWMADHVLAHGGRLLTSVAELNLDSQTKMFFSDTLDYPLALYGDNQHPGAFFSYTPELVLSYVKQFNINICEQYNKINFYQVPPRPKYNWTSNLGGVSAKAARLFDAWLKSRVHPQKHVWGSQEDVICQLTGNK